MTQQGRFLPGAAVILIGHLSTHTGPATQRTKGCQGQQGMEVSSTHPPTNNNPGAPGTTCRCAEINPVLSWRASMVPQKEPWDLSCGSLTVKQVYSYCSFCLKYSFPNSLPGLPLGSFFQEALLD